MYIYILYIFHILFAGPFVEHMQTFEWIDWANLFKPIFSIQSRYSVRSAMHGHT